MPTLTEFSEFFRMPNHCHASETPYEHVKNAKFLQIHDFILEKLCTYPSTQNFRYAGLNCDLNEDTEEYFPEHAKDRSFNISLPNFFDGQPEFPLSYEGF